MHPLRSVSGRTLTHIWSAEEQPQSLPNYHWRFRTRNRHRTPQYGIQLRYLYLNLDFPTNEETYMHRAGRAGRFGRKGKCLSFLPPKANKEKDWTRLDRVVKKYNLKILELPKTVSAFTFWVFDLCIWLHPLLKVSLFSVCLWCYRSGKYDRYHL